MNPMDVDATRWGAAHAIRVKQVSSARGRTVCTLAAALAGLALVAPSQAQQPIAAAPDLEAGATAIRCELRTIRAPDATQVLYFYISDARRTVYETDGTTLGNIVQFSPQRIVVSRSNVVEGGVRAFTFDRMIGSLTVTVPAQAGARESYWAMSGACQKVDAGRQKF